MAKITKIAIKEEDSLLFDVENMKAYYIHKEFVAKELSTVELLLLKINKLYQHDGYTQVYVRGQSWAKDKDGNKLALYPRDIVINLPEREGEQTYEEI